jgi:hypothetical protein
MTANDVFSRVIRDSEPLVQLLIFAAVTSGLWLAIEKADQDRREKAGSAV